MDSNQALGYMLLACKRSRYAKEQAREMDTEFDFKTEEEVERLGHQYYNDL
jgi:hypothetical protein